MTNDERRWDEKEANEIAQRAVADYVEKMHPAFQVCQHLMNLKSADYGASDHARSKYFPFGEQSYAQMLHTKMERIKSIIEKQARGEDANFESLKDSVMDIINYGAFFYAYLDEKEQ